MLMVSFKKLVIQQELRLEILIGVMQMSVTQTHNKSFLKEIKGI